MLRGLILSCWFLRAALGSSSQSHDGIQPSNRVAWCVSGQASKFVFHEQPNFDKVVCAIIHQLQNDQVARLTDTWTHLSLFAPLACNRPKLFANFKRTVSLDAFIVLVHNEEVFDGGLSDHGADFEAAPVGNGDPLPLELLSDRNHPTPTTKHQYQHQYISIFANDTLHATPPLPTPPLPTIYISKSSYHIIL